MFLTLNQKLEIIRVSEKSQDKLKARPLAPELANM